DYELIDANFHGPLLLGSESNPTGNRHTRPFRFMEAWLRHENFLNHISCCWRDMEGFNNKIRNLYNFMMVKLRSLWKYF
ncbi:hypothetical protein CR513_26691, partial [Mucuna pruriens]